LLKQLNYCDISSIRLVFVPDLLHFRNILVSTTIQYTSSDLFVLNMDSTWNPWFSEVFTSPATIHIPSNNQPAWLQPQPQSDAAAPPGSERTEAKKFTAGDWETHEQEITRLYDENSLASIMKLMKERHGLEAT
jgi:hypothetical protein